nr:hypothetical protein [Halomonas elongata]
MATLLRNRPDIIPKIAQKAVDMERFEREDVSDQAKKPQKRSNTG